MRKPTVTPAIANAVGMDAGNASARNAGRTRWSKRDFRAACRAAAPLWKIINTANQPQPK